MNGLDLAALAAFVAAGCVVLLLARAWRALRDRTLAARAAEERRLPGSARDPAPSAPGARLLAPLAALVEPLLPVPLARRLDALLEAAARSRAATPAGVVAEQIAWAIGAALVAASAIGAFDAASAQTGGVGRTAGLPLVAAVSALAGAAVPVARLRDRVRTRRRQAGRQLPALLDLLTLALEAGQGVSSALALAAERLPAGALRDELDRVLAAVRTGRPRADALRAMAQRLELPAAAQLAATLAAGERHGASLGAMLRAQAAQCRQERFVRAERLALEAPVKLLAPLALCIFPGTFAVLLVPVAVRLLAEGML